MAATPNTLVAEALAGWIGTDLRAHNDFAREGLPDMDVVRFLELVSKNEAVAGANFSFALVEGAFNYVGDHLMLIARSPGGARLRIDYPLFRTLRRLGRGLPRKLVPEREVHRLDAFLEKLGATRSASGDTIWSVHLEHMQVLRVGLSPDRRRYETVRVDA